jgi:diguanylate cyclase (GGDEF)-like protein
MSMQQLLHSLAAMTALRSRELLDLAFAQSVQEATGAQRVVLAMPIVQDDERRWLDRVVFEHGQPLVWTDPMWVQFDKLSTLAAHSLHERAVASRRIQADLGGGDASGATTVVPHVGESAVDTLIEITTAEPLTEVHLRTLTSMQRVYGNMRVLLEQAERDLLTGLNNRRSFDDALYKALSRLPWSMDILGANLAAGRRATESTDTYWIGRIDIDHFHMINERCSQVVGDEILLLAAQLAREQFRFHDQLHRFGTDQFVVLLRARDAAGAMLAFERFRRAMQGSRFPQVGQVTVSIGISALRADDTPAAALQRAEEAAWAAKQAGRNRVAEHEELVRLGQLAAQSKVGGVELFTPVAASVESGP